MLRATKVRIYPTLEQAEFLNRQFGAVRLEQSSGNQDALVQGSGTKSFSQKAPETIVGRGQEKSSLWLAWGS